MLGCSIYLNDFDEAKINDLKRKGFDIVFTSLHIPEYKIDPLKELEKLLGICNKNDITLFSDSDRKIYTDNVEKIFELIENGLKLRLDYGFSLEDIKILSLKTKIAINASTMDLSELKKLEKIGADFNNLIARHNYYPKKYSGISKEFFEKQNNLARKFNMKIFSFVSGNINLRGPMYEYLPTIEDSRGKNPYVEIVKMFEKYKVDSVFVSEGIRDYDLKMAKDYMDEKLIILPADLYASSFRESLSKIYHNRKDESKYLIRAQESRLTNRDEILRFNNSKRNIGDITIDNDGFKRYKGEINIVKSELEEDDRCNILGRVKSEYFDLLEFIKGGGKFKIDGKHN